jgi:O-antigen ligase
MGKGPGSANELMDDVLYRLEIGHPLNEYLRFLHDEGLVGFLLFLAGVSQLLILCWRAYRRSLVNHYPNSPFYLATFLALLAALLSMLTDNTASYIFVMGPLGVMVGTTLRSLALDTSTVIAATDHGESADFGLARSSL